MSEFATEPLKHDEPPKPHAVHDPNRVHVPHPMTAEEAKQFNASRNRFLSSQLEKEKEGGVFFTKVLGEGVGILTFVVTAIPAAFAVPGFVRNFKANSAGEAFFKRLAGTAKEHKLAAVLMALPFVATPLTVWRTRAHIKHTVEKETQEILAELQQQAPETSDPAAAMRANWSQDARNQPEYKADIARGK